MNAGTGVTAARPWLIGAAALAILAIFIPVALPALGLGLAIGGHVTYREAETGAVRGLGVAMLVTGVGLVLLSLVVILGSFSGGGESEVTTW